MSQAFTLVMGTWSSQKSPPKEQGYKNNGFFIAFCALLVIVRLTTNIWPKSSLLVITFVAAARCN